MALGDEDCEGAAEASCCAGSVEGRGSRRKNSWGLARGVKAVRVLLGEPSTPEEFGDRKDMPDSLQAHISSVKHRHVHLR